MNYPRRLLAGCLFLLFTQSIQAETVAVVQAQPDSPAVVAERVTKLENTVKDQQAANKSELDLLQQKLEQYLFFRDWEFRLLFTVIGVIAGIAWSRRNIDEIVQQQRKEIEDKLKADLTSEQEILREQLKTWVHTESATIENTFAKTRMEERFKKESRILIISDKIDSGLDNDFVRFGFDQDHVRRASFSMAYDADTRKIVVHERDHDLIVLDCLDNDDLLNYLSVGKQSAYLVYYPGRYNNPPDSQKTNFSNSKLTLYPRALQVLHYKNTYRLEQ